MNSTPEAAFVLKYSVKIPETGRTFGRVLHTG
jgi:hypothetical protein